MAKIQTRRAVSVRAKVYDRLMHYVTTADPNLGLAGSNVVEAALAEYLDKRGVPTVVPAYVRPSDAAPVGPKSKGDTCTDAPGAHFTF